MPRYSVAALPAGVHLYRCAGGHEMHSGFGLVNCTVEAVLDLGDPRNGVPPTVGPHGVPVVELTDDDRVDEVSVRMKIDLRIERASAEARKAATDLEPPPVQPPPPIEPDVADVAGGGRRG